MKSIITSIFAIITACYLLLPSPAASSPAQSQRLHDEMEKLSGIFRVAVAKEPVYFILVEKNRQRLRVLEFDEGLRIIADYPIATGKNPGDKKVDGDSRTPEGIYFITQIYKDKQVTIFGDRAFHLDYPNFFDQKAGRNGDGIYIHGTNRALQSNSTNGCVILDKKDLDDLEKFLQKEIIPVVIVPELNTTVPATDQLTVDDFLLTKSLIFAKETKSENFEFNYLYLINSGKQTVALSDFTYHPFNRTALHGTGKAYLEYLPAEGWSAGNRILQASPLQIYPETSGKILMLPMSEKNMRLPY